MGAIVIPAAHRAAAACKGLIPGGLRRVYG